MIIRRKNYMFALRFTSAQHSWYARMEFSHILHYSGMWDVLIDFIFFFFFLFWLGCSAWGILISQPGIESGPLAVEAWSPNH